MERKAKRMVVAGAVVAVVTAAAGVGIAATRDDQPLQGSSAERAVEAALDHTGGGDVLETEVGDDGAAYSVEIRKPDGSVVEVNLDERYSVIGTEADDDGAESADDDSD